MEVGCGFDQIKLCAVHPRGIDSNNNYLIMELGFVEEADPKELTSPFFPSKVGGKPAWLDLSRVPSVETLSCSKCGKPLIHLLQIQSSSSSGDQEHHRTFFLFLCPDSKCHSPGDASSFMALRCEKKSVSESHNTSDNKEAHLISTNSSACDNRSPLSSVTNSGASSLVRKESDVTLTPLCIVCGGQGHKHCGRCKCTHYCSRDHQLHDWKAGHKKVCPELVQGQCCLETLEYDPSVGVVLPELEIVTEPEPASCLEEDKERSEEERMKEYQEYMGDGKVEEVGRVEELEKIANAGKKKDKQFRVFKKRISAEPTQVSARIALTSLSTLYLRRKKLSCGVLAN